MSMPSFEETNNPGYDDLFNNSTVYPPKDDKNIVSEVEFVNTGLPSFEETNKPGYDQVFNSGIKKKKRFG
jgi:hypothetical protein